MANFFDKAKSFGMKKMVERQLKGVPQEEQDKLLNAVESNPEFFERIAAEIKKRTDGGMDQMKATMEVMQQNQNELQKMFGENR